MICAVGPRLDRRQFLLGATGVGMVLAGGGCRFPWADWGDWEPSAPGVPAGFDYPMLAGLELPFVHGVASGDPTSDAVVIWTRLTLPDPPASATVRWRVSTVAGFRDVVAQGSVVTGPERDWTVKVDVAGLDPGTTYFYDFAYEGLYSNRGRMRTVPALAQGLDVAVVSCSSYWSGYWNAYQRLAQRDELDLVVHCGDHIYDSVDSGEWVRARLDRFDPTYVDFRRPESLEEVRRRYALHYSDPDLALLRAVHPMTIAWDNHDVDGGDDPTGSRQAFWEWTACRPPDPVVAPDGNLVPGDVTRDHRHVAFGEVDLYVLDLRTRSDAATILGAEQRAWFEAALVDSTTRGAPWRLVVNPIPIADVALGGTGYGGWTDRPGDRSSLLQHLIDNEIDDTIFLAGDAHGAFVGDLPVDQSNGYDPLTGAGSAAVEILGNSVSRGGADESIAETIYQNLYGTTPQRDLERYEPLLAQAQATVQGIESSLLAENPALRYAQWRDHGYGLVHLEPSAAVLEQWHVPHRTVTTDQWLGGRFRVARGSNHVVPLT